MGTIAEMQKKADTNKPFKVEVLSEKRLENENSKYNKCIYCLKEGKQRGWTSDKLMSYVPNLTIIKTKELYKRTDGTIYVIFETFYRCSKCNAELTVEDFEKRYCKKYYRGDK